MLRPKPPYKNNGNREIELHKLILGFMIISTILDISITYIMVDPSGDNEANPMARWGIKNYGKEVLIVPAIIESTIGILLTYKLKNWITLTTILIWGYLHWAGFLSWQWQLFQKLYNFGFGGILIALLLYPIPIIIILIPIIKKNYPIKGVVYEKLNKS